MSFGPNATVAIELGGVAAGSEYDQIDVAGDLTLDGSLEVSFLNGFMPTAGMSFNILDWGSLSGDFLTVDLPPIPGLAWNVANLYTDGMLSVVAATLPGDFDLDGDVDGDDLTQWEGDFGVNDLSDADNDGDSDGADFLAWQQQLGSVPAAPAAGAVPEPAAWALIAAGALGGWLRRRPS